MASFPQSQAARSKAARLKTVPSQTVPSQTLPSQTVPSQTVETETAQSPPLQASIIQQARNQPVGELGVAAVQRYFQAAIARTSAVLADRDPEDLHQMRVSLRQLRTAIAVFSPALDLPERLGDRPIARIAKALGQVRDLDVLRQWLKHYQKQSKLKKTEVQILTKLDRRLHKQRQTSMQVVHKLLCGQQYQNFVVEVQRWLESPRYQPAGQLPIAALLADLLLPLMSQFLLHPGWWVATRRVEGQVEGQIPGQLVPQASLSSKELTEVLQHQGNEFHALRKQVKRLRYPAELLQGLFGGGYGDRLKEFKALQTILGDFQDEVVLGQVLCRELGDRWPQKLPSLADYLEQQQQARWQQWQLLQARYLDLDFRQELRQMLLS